MRRRTWLILAFVAACGGAPHAPDAAVDAGAVDAPPAAHRTLFVGNSYVYTNDVPARYRAALAPTLPDVRTEQVAPGGWRLAQHATDAATDGTDLARWLRTGTAAERDFDVVVFQEQSQIGAFPVGGFQADERLVSLAAIAELGALASAGGARVVLYMTWGREYGDQEIDPMTFGEFTRMEAWLEKNYVFMAEHLRAHGVAEVRVAPVGAAFRTIFDDIIAAGDDPLAEGSAFDALYEPDGSHPSVHGAYLAACVLAATATDADPRAFPDDAALGSEASARLRDACARAVADPRWTGLPQLVQDPGPYAALRPDAAARSQSYLLATSADGQRALITPSQGEVRALVHGPSGWETDAILPIPTTLTAYVQGLALAADGTRALAGAASLDDGAGAVYAYHRDDAGWHSDGPILLAPGVGRGSAVAMSRDGAYAFVATQTDVRALHATPTGWAEDAAIPRVAHALAVDATGTRAVLASRNEHAVYARSGTAWTEEDVVPAAFGPRDISAAMTDAGDRFAVLGPNESVSHHVVVVVRSGATWTVEGETTFLTGGGVNFPALAMNPTGTQVLVGTPERQNPLGSGVVHLFTRTDATWAESHLLIPPDRFDNLISYRFGTACSIATATALCAQPGLVGVAGSYHGIRTFQLPSAR